jgi:hypothetical protein
MGLESWFEEKMGETERWREIGYRRERYIFEGCVGGI